MEREERKCFIMKLSDLRYSRVRVLSTGFRHGDSRNNCSEEQIWGKIKICGTLEKAPSVFEKETLVTGGIIRLLVAASEVLLSIVGADGEYMSESKAKHQSAQRSTV